MSYAIRYKPSTNARPSVDYSRFDTREDAETVRRLCPNADAMEVVEREEEER